MKRQDALIARLGKDAERFESLSQKLTEELQGEEDKANQRHKVTTRLEASLDQIEVELQTEKKQKQEVRLGI